MKTELEDNNTVLLERLKTLNIRDKKFNDVIALYLFGSRSKGTYRQDGDVDILIGLASVGPDQFDNQKTSIFEYKHTDALEKLIKEHLDQDDQDFDVVLVGSYELRYFDNREEFLKHRYSLRN